MQSQTKDHYNFREYFTFSRWVSFYEQISVILNCSPINILEIGLGSRLIYAYLKELGFKVTGFDIDKSLNPDVVGDVRKLSGSFSDDQFDLVCCFQVLEHLPFEEFENSVRNIARVTSRHVAISLPFAGYSISFALRISKVGEIKAGFAWKIPRFWEKHKYDGIHYWEIGKRGYSLKKVVSILSSYFEIKEIRFVEPNKGIVIFVLKKK